jgi:hydroxyethylthiazole kinase
MPAEGEEMRASPDVRAFAQAAADILARLRAKAPRVHCITNSVAQNFTANVLLAAGAQPSMTIAPEEIGHFVVGADALLVNLGTFDQERAEAIDLAVAAATADRRPWVLDPVLIDRSPPRAALARELVARRPRALRLNAVEFSALAERPMNADSLADFAKANTTVVALSGATDLVADGARFAAVANGHPLMARITAMGCAGSALVAACLAVEDDNFLASLAGLLMLGVAGEVAGAAAKGPGSFAVAFLDALYRLEPATLVDRARVS